MDPINSAGTYTESIIEESWFQAIVKDVEAKYQAEHERIGKWLEKQGML